MPAMPIAHFRGLGARDEVLLYALRTRTGGELARLGINCFLNHAGWRLEILRVFVRRQEYRAFHELGPDGSGGLAARKPEIAVIVESNPDDAKQIRSESSEPAVMRRSCLPCGGCGKSQRAHRRARSSTDDSLHERSCEECNSGVENRTSSHC